jgi:dienelactone hydrolase
MSKLASVAFLSSALWAGFAAAQAIEQLSVPVDWQGRQIQLRADFQKPPGAGPFPAVIALHACGGYDDPYSIGGWLTLFRQQGYATLHLDSFTARGYPGGILFSNCTAVTGAERASDALAAAYVLAGRPDVRRDRIAVIGWSHGGGGAARVTKDWVGRRPAREKLASVAGKLVASVDFYGGCGAAGYSVVVPLLVLVGADDDWNSGGATCLELAKAQPTLVTVQVYPGVYHGFDSEGGGTAEFRSAGGHVMRYDPVATADARIRVTEFLRRYMQ